MAYEELRLRRDILDMFLEAQTIVFDAIRQHWVQFYAPTLDGARVRQKSRNQNEGLCLDCSGYSRPDKLYCEGCQERRTAKKRARQNPNKTAEGFSCSTCGKPGHNKRTCPS